MLWLSIYDRCYFENCSTLSYFFISYFDIERTNQKMRLCSQCTWTVWWQHYIYWTKYSKLWSLIRSKLKLDDYQFIKGSKCAFWPFWRDLHTFFFFFFLLLFEKVHPIFTKYGSDHLHIKPHKRFDFYWIFCCLAPLSRINILFICK